MKGIDLGKQSKCNTCNERFCTCPERQPDGDWIPVNLSPVSDWGGKFTPERLHAIAQMHGFSKEQTKIIDNITQETRTQAKAEGYREVEKIIKKFMEIKQIREGDADPWGVLNEILGEITSNEEGK